MSEMLPKSAPPPDRRRGCLSGAAVVLLVCVGLFVWGTVRDRSMPEIDVTGQITISQSTNMFISGSSCAGRGDFDNIVGGEFVTIRPADRSPDVVEIRPGMIVNGTCILRFNGTVKESDSYNFRISGLPPLTVSHSLVDTVGDSGETELDVTLSWD